MNQGDPFATSALSRPRLDKVSYLAEFLFRIEKTTKNRSENEKLKKYEKFKSWFLFLLITSEVLGGLITSLVVLCCASH